MQAVLHMLVNGQKTALTFAVKQLSSPTHAQCVYAADSFAGHCVSGWTAAEPFSKVWHADGQVNSKPSAWVHYLRGLSYQNYCMCILTLLPLLGLVLT